MILNYQKRRNTDLFKSLEEKETLFLSKTQNYIPIYQKFFELNETNYNHINLNHKWFIHSVKQNESSSSFAVECKIKNIQTEKTKSKDVFFKMAPLLDPFKYLVGKYDVHSSNLFNLPGITNNEQVHQKILDVNNAAYVDSFFVFLTNLVQEQHPNFFHGLQFYGSFLAIKNNYEVNIFDDLEYLDSSDFFNKNKGNLFKVDDYEHIFRNEAPKKPALKIDDSTTELVVQEFDDSVFDDLFQNDNTCSNDEEKLEIVDFTYMNLESIKDTATTTSRSTSTCSSRTSHTSSENSMYEEHDLEVNEEDEECKSLIGQEEEEGECDENSSYEDIEDDEDEDEEEEPDEIIKATINSFPVQVIAMESCEDTLDNLILSNDLKKEEWYSALMQIIMTLITYQKCFSFTHNDLHTNNVMYNTTDKKYLYYCYKKTYYKVPTFGRIFKIIDFGRSIYKFDGKLFCSDSYQEGGDAASQYNTEPYFNDKKPRLEPNFSFDLCRLACSMFDYVVDDLEEVKDLKKCKDPIKRIITEWCLDDKGTNLLYKNNGADRYPDFKLYKMIARYVHNHTPQAQLSRPEFKSFITKSVPQVDTVLDIDAMSVYI